MGKKLTSDEITALLVKNVTDVLGNDEEQHDSKDNSVITKQISALAKQVSNLTDFVSKNVQVEQPKTVAEQIEEGITAAMAKITAKSADKTGTETDENKKIGELTAKELDDRIGAAIAKSLEKVVQKPAGKGKGKDSNLIDMLVSTIAKSNGISEEELAKEDDAEEMDADEEADEDLEKSAAKPGKNGIKIETVETHDQQGNEIPLAKRQSMQQLDDYIGSVMQSKMHRS